MFDKDPWVPDEAGVKGMFDEPDDVAEWVRCIGGLSIVELKLCSLSRLECFSTRDKGDGGKVISLPRGPLDLSGVCDGEEEREEEEWR